MAKTSFENLEVYQLAERPSDTIWKVATSWEHFAKSTLGTQIVRSADSISANIAEGCGRFNYKDNAKFIRIARGSCMRQRIGLGELIKEAC